MKILVISDSHGRLERLISIYEKEQPDVVICAGDHSEDGKNLSFIHSEAKYYIVKGNCDFYDIKSEDEMVIELGEHKVLLAHGHHYGVKQTYGIIEARGRELGCDIVIFGHTHRQELIEKDGITLFNPGAVLSNQYGILKLDKENIDFLQKRS